MPEYTSNAYLTKKTNDGQEYYPPGTKIELTEEEAKRLGNKLTEQAEREEIIAVGVTLTEAQFRSLSADEQKREVHKLGGDLSEVTNEDQRTEFYLNHA